MTPPSQGGEESTTAALASLRTRQEHREAAALSLSGLDGHTAAMGLRDAAHDRQAEARAAPFAMRLAVGLEDVRERVRGDAHAGVLDLQLELRPGVDHPHDHAAAGRSEPDRVGAEVRSEEHTSELQSRQYLVCRLLLEKKKKETSSVMQPTRPSVPNPG